VFTTRDVCVGAGIRPSSASRALRRASQADIVERMARGVWRRNDSVSRSVVCYGPHPFAAAWMHENEAMLDAVFGLGPRRISHMMALEAGGVPLVTCPQYTLPHDAPQASLPGVATVFREQPAALTRFASRLTERTWMSSPTRAALEVAQQARSLPLWDERIAWAFAEAGAEMLDLDEAVEAGSALRLRAGLRRVTSIADALISMHGQIPGADLSWVPARWADAGDAHRGDKWIHLWADQRPLQGADAPWVDRRRKVRWGRHPRHLAIALLT